MESLAGAAGFAVYPRSRGEHSRPDALRSSLSGLSPLAWGTRRASFHGVASVRFIPARVGNTSTDSAELIENTVYPRSRGEHSPIVWSCKPNGGLSPLAWGTRNLHEPTSFQRPVYPRSRGEHVHASKPPTYPTGLSPLAWGTLDGALTQGKGDRFIPARVGNTAQTARMLA